jgi:hypothetical protein
MNGAIHLPSLIEYRKSGVYGDAPSIFTDLFEYSKLLQFSDRPDYEFWIGRFKELKSILVDFSTLVPPRFQDTRRHIDGVEWKYVSEYYARLEDWNERKITCDCKNCPPKKFFVVERRGDVPFELHGGALAQCVRSAVRKVQSPSDTAPKWEGVIVKVPRKYWKEKIVTEVYGDSGVTPIVYTADGVDSACAACMLIMETAGTFDLEEYRMQRPSVPVSAAVTVAIRAIEIMRKFHNRGFVHGDIHMGNFSFKIFDSIKLIDFDRSVPFLDPISQRHVRPAYQQTRYDKDHLFRLNKAMLSVYELESIAAERAVTLSRRDDWFRLAESLVNFFILDNDLFKLMREFAVEGRKSPVDPQVIIRAKRERMQFLDPGEFPEIFMDFYQATMKMEFEERPGYEYWLNQFRTFAV